MFEYKNLKIAWLGHDAFRISNSKTLYIDPYELSSGAQKADIILVTHEHFDHLSINDLAKIVTPATTLVASANCTGKFGSLKAKSMVTMKPGDRAKVNGVEISAVPAYNTNKFRAPGEPFHPKNQGHVGYIINLDNVTIYHTGDTDSIPEMKDITVDIALIPVSGTYVMTAEEAVEAVRKIKTKVAIPMHYGSIVGSEKDAEKFKQHAPCEVKILKKTI